jgi:hypothetical protein
MKQGNVYKRANSNEQRAKLRYNSLFLPLLFATCYLLFDLKLLIASNQREKLDSKIFHCYLRPAICSLAWLFDTCSLLFCISLTQKMPSAFFARRQATGDRRQATGDRRQATGDRRQATGDRQLYSPANQSCQQSTSIIQITPKNSILSSLTFFFFLFYFFFCFCGYKPKTNGISIYTLVGGSRLKADITVFTRLKRRCRQKERFL